MVIYYFFARFLLHFPVFPQTQSDGGHSAWVLCDGQFTCCGCADLGCAGCCCGLDGFEATFLVLFGEASPAKAAFRVATSRFSASTRSMACFNSASTRESSFMASSRWSCLFPVGEATRFCLEIHAASGWSIRSLVSLPFGSIGEMKYAGPSSSMASSHSKC